MADHACSVGLFKRCTRRSSRLAPSPHRSITSALAFGGARRSDGGNAAAATAPVEEGADGLARLLAVHVDEPILEVPCGHCPAPLLVEKAPNAKHLMACASGVEGAQPERHVVVGVACLLQAGCRLAS